MGPELGCWKAPPGFRDVPNLAPLQPTSHISYLSSSFLLSLFFSSMFLSIRSPLFGGFRELWLAISLAPETRPIATYRPTDSRGKGVVDHVVGIDRITLFVRATSSRIWMRVTDSDERAARERSIYAGWIVFPADSYLASSQSGKKKRKTVSFQSYFKNFLDDKFSTVQRSETAWRSYRINARTCIASSVASFAELTYERLT